ncbi:MAG: hypothetical protein ABSA27_08245 [Terriglobales bacterium]
MKRETNLFLALFAGVVLVGSCVAEDGSKAPSTMTNPDTGAQARIFQGTENSQKLRSAVAQDVRNAQVSNASIRPASGEELDGMELTLQKYRTAFDSLSLPQMRQVWPGLDHRRESALNDVFKFLKASSATRNLGLECAPPTVIGDSAKVECRETLAYSDAKGKAKATKPAMVSISLKKQSDNWVVETMKGLGSAD